MKRRCTVSVLAGRLAMSVADVSQTERREQEKPKSCRWSSPHQRQL